VPRRPQQVALLPQTLMLGLAPQGRQARARQGQMQGRRPGQRPAGASSDCLGAGEAYKGRRKPVVVIVVGMAGECMLPLLLAH